MGLFDKISDTLDKVGNKVDSFVNKVTPSWVPNELRDIGKIGLLGMPGGALALNAYARKQGLVGTPGGAGFTPQDMWYSQPGFMFPEFAAAEFIPIEAMGEINVTGLLDEMAGINRETTKENFGIAQEMGRTVAGNAFTDFEAFLDKILPEADGLTRSVARTAQEFIETGLPRAVMGNAILRDSQMFAATGTRGDVAVRRGLANEAARDTAGVQYGVGLAQELVNQARATALPFAQLGAQATQANLGLLTNLTTISPMDRINTAFNERNYQTQVMQYNASNGMAVSQFNAGQANQMSIAGAQLGMQQQQMAMEYQMYQDQLAMQRKQAEDAKDASLFSILGTVGGALGGLALAPATGGASLAYMAAGAGFGGGVGQMAGGFSTGNYGLAAQGLATGLSGLGAYQSWQGQQAQLGMQQQMLGLQQQALSSQAAYNMALLNKQGALPKTQAGFPFSSTNTGSWLYNSFGVR